MTSTDKHGLGDVLGDLEQHLQRLKDEGVRTVPVSKETLKSLSSPVAPAAWTAEAKASAVGPEASLRAGKAQAPLAHSKASDSTPASLVEIGTRIAACKACRLCETRTNVVPGQGNPAPEIMFVGEGPGEDEDKQGLAFVGRAGQLLTRLITRMGLTRDEVFIGNIVKCRPPGNRVPNPDEMEACLPFLREQIAILKPKVIVALGGTAIKGLFGPTVSGITKLRGTWKTYEGIDTMPTYHPSYLLRSGGDEKARYWEVWSDMEQVLKKIGRTAPAGRGQ